MLPTREEWYKALEERHGEELQRNLSKATVAICGLGGLGSNIAVYLARAGIGKLILIDFDCVDITNIHRQQYKANQIGMYKTEAMLQNILEIAPYTEVFIHTAKILEENMDRLLADSDIICEAFDDAKAKSMLTNYVLEKYPEKYLIAASGMAGLGSANSLITRKITDKFYLCGDGVSEVLDDVGLVSSRVALCAAHQSHAVLRILAKQFDA